MATRKRARESQNQSQIESYVDKGPVQMGPWSSHIWRNDPRHIGFMLARYKFCAKMLIGKKRVLEFGCGDALGTPIVLQSVESVHGVDFEPLIIADLRKRLGKQRRFTYEEMDLTKESPKGPFDAAYSLDTIEHIPPSLESRFVKNVVRSLKKDAICIMGTPNISAAPYASEASQAGHVNLKSADTMRETLLEHFQNVFVFSMNDEIVHTGFSPMAHYILGVGVGRR